MAASPVSTDSKLLALPTEILHQILTSALQSDGSFRLQHTERNNPQCNDGPSYSVSVHFNWAFWNLTWNDYFNSSLLRLWRSDPDARPIIYVEWLLVNQTCRRITEVSRPIFFASRPLTWSEEIRDLAKSTFPSDQQLINEIFANTRKVIVPAWPSREADEDLKLSVLSRFEKLDHLQFQIAGSNYLDGTGKPYTSPEGRPHTSQCYHKTPQELSDFVANLGIDIEKVRVEEVCLKYGACPLPTNNRLLPSS